MFKNKIVKIKFFETCISFNYYRLKCNLKLRIFIIPMEENTTNQDPFYR